MTEYIPSLDVGSKPIKIETKLTLKEVMLIEQERERVFILKGIEWTKTNISDKGKTTLTFVPGNGFIRILTKDEQEEVKR